jgi:hypothetical protein
MTMDYNEKVPERTTKADVVANSFLDVEAMLDGVRISLPAELPHGKHRLMIRGRCP